MTKVGFKHSEESRKKMSKAHTGMKASEEAKRHISESRIAEKNPYWKGDRVGLGGLHQWVKVRLPKPASCENCHAVEPHDLSNRSEKYLRDLSDWEWLCRRCHMMKDGRMKNLTKGIQNIRCETCNKIIIHNRYGWFHLGGGEACSVPRERRKPKEASQ